jgi:hypothetical protein
LADRGSGQSPTSPVLDLGLGLDRGPGLADRGRADMALADRDLADRGRADMALADLGRAARGPGMVLADLDRALVDLVLADLDRALADRVLADLDRALADRGRVDLALADRGPGRVLADLGLADRGLGRRLGLSRTRRRELSIEATRRWAARQMRPTGSARMVMVHRLRRHRQGSAGTMARLPVARRLTGKARRLRVAGTARRLPVGGTAHGTARRGI